MWISALLAICAQSTAAAPAELVLGPWRATLASPGGELPFELELARAEGGELEAVIGNRRERIAVPEARLEQGELVLALPHYDAELRARVGANGHALAGVWRKRTGAETFAELPFRSTAGAAPRFTPLTDAEGEAGRAQPPALAPRWSVRFSASEDPAVLLLEEGPGGVEGTVLTTTGDYRFLAGSLEGRRLRLSCFDGAHAFLLAATLGEDGALAGDFWSRDTWHETWTARPDPTASLPDAFRETRWTERVALADLAFPDEHGVRRSLADPAFAGRARLLVLFGTWCPNCHDEAAYLAELERRYGPRGLTIVGLAFELTGDLARSAGQVRRFRARHGLRYPVLVAGLADKERASRAFPALDRVRAFPTTVFLDAAGRVRAVHSGFAGPATGEAHARLRAEFEGLIETLLAEGDGGAERERPPERRNAEDKR